MGWNLDAVGSQHGKTALVTGSNTGIGLATVRALARKGARVLLACRNPQKGTDALARLRTEVPDCDAALIVLDLARLASVRVAADAVLAQTDRLDLLINNAGLMMPPFSRTEDGFELQFGTNVLGHFALTGHLLPLLERTSQARVVWLSSLTHWTARIDFANLNAEKGYKDSREYGQSKLANLMLAYEMDRRLKRTGGTTLSVAAHPGFTRSELTRDLKLINLLAKPFLQPTDDGALPSLRAALDPTVRGGEHFGPGGFAAIAGAPTRQRSSRRSQDPAVAAQLWETCEALTGVRYLD
ncbi:MAG TPA: oxidoreductase [Nevskiaceae bacterium]|nr:oxidoreductase [Nevskiaceae bacterium]